MEPESIEEHEALVASEIGRGINAFETSLRYLRKILVGLIHSALARSGGRKIDGDIGVNMEGESSQRYGLLQMTDILLRNLDAKQVFYVAKTVLVHQARCVDLPLSESILDFLKRFDVALEVRNILAHCAWDFRRSDATGQRDISRIIASRVTRRPTDGPGYETREFTFTDLVQATAFLKDVQLRMAHLCQLVVDMGYLDEDPGDDFDTSFARKWADDIKLWLKDSSSPAIWKQVKLEDDPIVL